MASKKPAKDNNKTDHADVERALKQSEDRMRLAVQVAEIGVFEHDHATDMIHYSPEFAKIHGVKSGGPIPAGEIFRLFHVDDRERVRTTVAECHSPESDEPVSCEHRITRDDRSVRWIRWRVRTFFDGESTGRKATRSIGAVIDLTDQRKVYTDLQKSRQRFENFMDNSPAVAFVKNEKGEYQYFNETFSKLFNLDLTDANGMTDFDYLPAEVAEQMKENDLSVLRKGKPVEIFEDVPDPDGTMRHWLSVKFPFTNSENVRCVGGVAIDQTELRKVELERNQFFETSTDFLCVADLNGHFTRINGTFSRVLGFQNEEILRKGFMEFIHPKDRQRTADQVGRLLQGEQAVQFENRYRCQDVSYRNLSWMVAPPAKNSNSVFAVGRDITEIKSLERSLLKIAEKEQRRIAHDLHDGLGQEMTGLTMMAESLAIELGKKSLPEFETAKKIADQLESTLQNVRAMAQGLRPVEVGSMGLESALERLAQQTNANTGIECHYSGIDPAIVEDDDTATHLYRIAQEAVTNAIKHGNPNKIEITLSNDGELIELKVIDDGIGIQGLTESQKGIGMKSMRYRCDLIGGNLRVESGPAGGTVVACKLATQ